MEELKKSKFDFLILDSFGDAVVVADMQMNIAYFNAGVETIFGYTLNEINRKHVQVLFHQEEWEKIIELIDSIETDKKFKGQMTCIHKNGSKAIVDAGISFITNGDKGKIGLLFVFRDLAEIKRLTKELAYSVKEMEFANREMLEVNSELENEIKLRNRIEEELRQQKIKLENLNADLENIVKTEVESNREKDRMMLLQSRQASMGEIIESVAHQWKQPLNTINLLLYEIDELSKGTEENYAYVKDKISDIYKVIRYMSDTIDDFRSFFIPGREKKLFPLADSVIQTSKFLEAEFRHAGIEIEFDLDENIIFNGFQNEITQVLLNILNNAKDAFVESKMNNPLLRIRLKRNGSNGLIVIEDNAGGIPEEILPGIFNAYVSSKRESKGTGLGLYIARSIVENNLKGSIMAKNAGSGAVFSIEVPIEQELI
jgi:PAS domain S-box-containing protein